MQQLLLLHVGLQMQQQQQQMDAGSAQQQAASSKQQQAASRKPQAASSKQQAATVIIVCQPLCHTRPLNTPQLSSNGTDLWFCLSLAPHTDTGQIF